QKLVMADRRGARRGKITRGDGAGLKFHSRRGDEPPGPLMRRKQGRDFMAQLLICATRLVNKGRLPVCPSLQRLVIDPLDPSPPSSTHLPPPPHLPPSG